MKIYNKVEIRFWLTWQSKGDVSGAEDYYLRATVADPKDGEIMMQYAKLVWELHRDQDKALTYFEKAVFTTPEDRYGLDF